MSIYIYEDRQIEGARYMENKIKKEPSLRFKGFNDDWEQRKLKSLGKTQSGIGFPDSEQGGKEGIPFYKISDFNSSGNESEMFISNNYVSNQQVIDKKWKPIDQIPAVIFAKVGAAIMLNRKRLVRHSFLIDNNTMAFIFDSSWDVNFGKTTFETLNLPKYAQVGALPSYNSSDIEAIEVIIPDKREQEKIGLLFSNLDSTIALHQRKLEKMKELKAACLQGMFPSSNEKVPNIRFSNFEEDWEQRKLGDIADFAKGSGYSKADLKPDGESRIVLYGRLYTKYETMISSIDTFADEKPNSVISKGYEVIVPASGESPEDIARASVIEPEGIIIGGDLNIIRPIKEISPYFLAINISNGEQKKELSKRAQGKSVVHLYNSDLKEVILKYPTNSEQSKIADFFTNIDQTIALHQNKLESLKGLKASFLQKMFV